MSDRNKILNFLIENNFEIIHFESHDSLRIHFEKAHAKIQIILDNVDFIEFEKEFKKVWSLVQEHYKSVEDQTLNAEELTEELLLKLGFSKWWYSDGQDEEFLVVEGLDEILFSLKTKTVYISTYPNNTFDTEIKYLHELQNLFSLIYKKELEFKN
jgi:hypothetical protein